MPRIAPRARDHVVGGHGAARAGNHRDGDADHGLAYELIYRLPRNPWREKNPSG
jgi:hypothetical protein